MERGWHRGSRYYKIGGHALYLAAGLAVLTIFKVSGSVDTALGVFGMIGSILLGGGAYVNVRERKIMEIRAEQGESTEEAGQG